MKISSTVCMHDSKVNSIMYDDVVYTVFILQGPNFIWHVDSYDKLKPFGFPINGCIDGYANRIVAIMVLFLVIALLIASYNNHCVLWHTCMSFRYSRRIMWLKVSTCSSAATVGQYYLECIKQIEGILSGFYRNFYLDGRGHGIWHTNIPHKTFILVVL